MPIFDHHQAYTQSEQPQTSKKGGKRKKLFRGMSAVIAVVLSVDYFAQQAFAYQTYDNITATANVVGKGSLINPSEPTTINAAVAMSLTGNTNTPIWELDQYPTTSPTNKGYLFVESSQLPGNNHTSFLGYYSGKTYANPQFVASELFASGDYAWGITNGGFPSATDFYALSDVTDINGMYDATPMNGSGGTTYLGGTNLAIRNVALPSIAPTLTSNGSTAVSTIAPGGAYYLNPNITSDGSNAGGLFTQNYLSAYWVPIQGGTPNYSAYQYALTQNNAGNATIYGWPDPGSVIASGGASSLSMGYPGGFPGGFEQVPYETGFTVNSSNYAGQLEVLAPSSFPSGTTGYDLVVYYGDGVERYDAQVLQVQVQPSPTLTLSISPITSQNMGTTFALTANTTDATDGTLTFGQSGTLSNNGGAGTLSGDYKTNQRSITYPSQVYGSFQYSPTATSTAAGTETITATLSVPGFSPIEKTVSVTWNPQAPTISIAASPTSLLTGKSSTLTIKTTNLQTGDQVVIAQTDTSVSGILSGNYQSGQTSITYKVSQPYSSFSFFPTATSASPETFEYTAIVENANGEALTQSAGPVAVTWTAPVSSPSTPSISLTLSPTSSQTTGSSFQIQAQTTNIAAGDTVTMKQLNASGTGSFPNGHTYYAWSSSTWGNESFASYNFNQTVTSSQAQSIQYQATLFDSSNGQTYTSNIVTAQWTTPVITQTPALTLTASSTSPSTGGMVALTAVSNQALPNNVSIVIHDMSGDDTLSGANSQAGPLGTATTSTMATSNTPRTVTYMAAMVLGGKVYDSNQVQVTWSGGAPSVSLSAYPTQMSAGQSTTMTYIATNLQPGDYVKISSAGSGTAMWNVNNQTSSTESFSESEDPVYPNTIQVSTIAILFNAQGQQIGMSGVNLTWTAPKPGITITASPQTMVPGQPSTITYSAVGMQGHEVVQVIGLSNNGAVNAWNTSSFYEDQSYIEIENPAEGKTISVSYVAEIINQMNGAVLASASTSVQWVNAWTGSVQLSGSPTLLPTGGTTNLTAQASASIPTGYNLVVMNSTTNQMVDETTSTTDQTQYATYSPETDVFVAYIDDGYEVVGAESDTVSVQWTGAIVTANPKVVPLGSSTAITATGKNMPSGDWLILENKTTGQVLGATQGTSITANPSESTAQTDNFVAYISTTSSTSQAIATSDQIPVQWYGAQLTASPTYVGLGSSTTLTASAQNMPNGYTLQITNQTTGQVIATGTPGETTVSATQSETAAQTDTYVAQIMHPAIYGYGLWAAVEQQPPAINVNGWGNPPATVATPDGVAMYTGTQWAWVGDPNGDAQVNTLAYDPVTQTTWVGTGSSGVAQWTGTQWTDMGSPGGNGNITKLMWSNSSNLMWVLTSTSVGYWNGSQWVMTPLPSVPAWQASYNISGNSILSQTGSDVSNAEPVSITDGANGSVLVLQDNGTWASNNSIWNGYYTYPTAGAQLDEWNGKTWVDKYDFPETETWGGYAPAMGYNGSFLSLMYTQGLAYDVKNGNVYIDGYNTDYHIIDNRNTGISRNGNGESEIWYAPLNQLSPITSMELTTSYSQWVSPWQIQKFGVYIGGYWNYWVGTGGGPNVWYDVGSGALTDNVATIVGTDNQGNLILSAPNGTMSDGVEFTSGGFVVSTPLPGYSGATSFYDSTANFDYFDYFDSASWPQVNSIATNGSNDYFGWAPDNGVVQTAGGTVGNAATSNFIPGSADVTENMSTVMGDATHEDTGVTALTWNANSSMPSSPSSVGATSSPVSVTWYQYQITLTANPSNLYITNPTTLTATVSNGAPTNLTLEIQNQANSLNVGVGVEGSTGLTTIWTENTPTTDTFVAYLVDPTTQQRVSSSNIVTVKWNFSPFTLTGASVYHTSVWQQHLDSYNAYYATANPKLVRTESDFWAGEDLLFRVHPSTENVAEATVQIQNLSMDSTLPSGAPVDMEFPPAISLTYNPADGDLEGGIPSSWYPWLEYIQNGTYAVSFWAKSKDNQVATATTTFTIWDQWVSGNDPGTYYHEHEVFIGG